jgi:hypothetical protein
MMLCPFGGFGECVETIRIKHQGRAQSHVSDPLRAEAHKPDRLVMVVGNSALVGAGGHYCCPVPGLSGVFPCQEFERAEMIWLPVVVSGLFMGIPAAMYAHAWWNSLSDIEEN